MKQGLIQIYTGDGKGKTTAAVGQAVRALGHNLKVCYISFFKDPAKWGYGEIGCLRKWGADVFHFALQHPCFCNPPFPPPSCFRTSPSRGPNFGRVPTVGKKAGGGLRGILQKKVRQECLEALGFISEIFKKDYDILILDEINICLRDGFLKENEILFLLKKKPGTLEIILTGRGATPGLIKRASLVTEMKKVKHPFDRGTKARKGIEC